MEKIYIFDTTLRDGEQSPGASLDINEKMEIAKQLARLGVDIIEAGFPIASKGDFEAVKRIAQEIEGSVICGLARAKETDIKTAWDALKHAKHPRIHTFIPSSDIQIKYQLRKTKEEVLKITEEMVSLAKSFTEDIEFSPMDATRSDHKFLYELIEVAIECGATTVNIPDTVGYIIPNEFSELIKSIIENVKNIGKAIISVHCHNDLGLSTSNALAAIQAGARQIECTINGIGERAGNTALEEVVMAIKTRKDLFGFYTNINTPLIYKTSRLVSHLTGMTIQPNKAIVGDNAFAHESGIHQDGVLKEKTTYEIMTPESVGVEKSKITLGKLSGRHAFKERLQQMGYALTEKELEEAFIRFKNLADRKKKIYDEDIEAIVEDKLQKIPEKFKLKYFHVACGNNTIPTATIKLERDDKIILQESAWGNGPVDAIYRAIDKIVELECELVDYSIKAVTINKDAQGEVTVKIKQNDQIYMGRGTSTDILEASTIAYINALNKYFYKLSKDKEQRTSL
jgi:2-isopropylmalate synthase